MTDSSVTCEELDVLRKQPRCGHSGKCVLLSDEYQENLSHIDWVHAWRKEEDTRGSAGGSRASC